MLALFSIRYQVNQVVVGVVLVAFASGLTAFLVNQIPDSGKGKEYLNQPPILEKIAIPGLSNLPLVGEALFTQTLLVYLMYVAIVRRPVRALPDPVGPAGALGRGAPEGRRHGRHPRQPVRWQAVLAGGGWPDSVAPTSPSGRSGPSTRTSPTAQGFIALAAVIMGRWNPVGATLAALFFGFMWNLQNQVGLVGKCRASSSAPRLHRHHHRRRRVRRPGPSARRGRRALREGLR